MKPAFGSDVVPSVEGFPRKSEIRFVLPPVGGRGCIGFFETNTGYWLLATGNGLPLGYFWVPRINPLGFWWVFCRNRVGYFWPTTFLAVIPCYFSLYAIFRNLFVAPFFVPFTFAKLKELREYAAKNF